MKEENNTNLASSPHSSTTRETDKASELLISSFCAIMTESPAMELDEHMSFNERGLDKRELFAYNYGMCKQVISQILGKLK